MQLGRLGEPLDVADGQADQEIHEYDGHEDEEEKDKDVGGEGEHLVLEGGNDLGPVDDLFVVGVVQLVVLKLAQHHHEQLKSEKLFLEKFSRKKPAWLFNFSNH